MYENLFIMWASPTVCTEARFGLDYLISVKGNIKVTTDSAVLKLFSTSLGYGKTLTVTPIYLIWHDFELKLRARPYHPISSPDLLWLYGNKSLQAGSKNLFWGPYSFFYTTWSNNCASVSQSCTLHI